MLLGLLEFFVNNSIFDNVTVFISSTPVITSLKERLNECETGESTQKDLKISHLHPNYVSGLSDAEATFTLSVVKDNRVRKSDRRKLGDLGRQILTFHPSFAISLNFKDIHLIKSLHCFFGVGNIKHDLKNSAVTFYVNSVEDLTNVIIPFFKNYPLISQKGSDFLLFDKAVNLLKQGTHLTTDGLNQIISIKASMNKGLSEVLTAQFVHII